LEGKGTYLVKRGREKWGTSPKNAETRADARPPEEAGSDDPKGQAEAILEESENRVEDGAKESAKKDKT
jgi:hypothetical protein